LHCFERNLEMELQGRRKNAYLGEDNNKDKDEGDDHSSGKRTFYSSLSFSISLLSFSCFWFTFPCVTFLVLLSSLSVSSSVLSQLPYFVICLIVLLYFLSNPFAPPSFLCFLSLFFYSFPPPVFVPRDLYL
jgi:hypothetical protein